ncbi:MAG TPA: PEP-CTERM sorting domain-containing protein [Candidatus Sulfopaludibacter sp.]|nr:PEP-CTERM sorting domain-containing protein [Candidatus Sulfopaludibacter sp.]
MGLASAAVATQVTFTPATPGVSYSVNDGTNFYVSGNPIALASLSAGVSGSNFQLSAPGSSYQDAGIVLFFGGGLGLSDLRGVSVVTDNPAAVDINIWIDTNQDGKFFAFDNTGLLTGLNGDSYGSFGNTTSLTPATTTQFMIGPAHGGTLGALQSGFGNDGAALWIGLTNPYTANISSVTVDYTPEPASMALFGCGTIGLALLLRRKSKSVRR